MASIRKVFGPPVRTVWLAWTIAGLGLGGASAWALDYAAAHGPGQGLQARVFAEAGFAGSGHLIAADQALDPVRAAREAGLDPERAFAIEWDGYAIATDDGLHYLRVRVDDGVAVWVNDHLLIEQLAPGQHDLSAPVRLTPGLHRLRVRYVQLGGDARFRLLWARPSWREHFVAIPVVAATPDLIFRRVDKALSYPTAIGTAWSLWILIGLALVFCTGVAHEIRLIVAAHPRSSAALAIAAAALLGLGIEIGAAPWRGWVPDELLPADFLHAAQASFLRHWALLYPPLHLYLISLVVSPFLLLASTGWLDLTDYDTQAVIHVVGRALTAVMGALTLVLTALIAHRTIGLRLAILAPFLLLTAPPFVFYSKTMNLDVPYVFWVSVGLLLFSRAATTRAIADHAGLGVAAALAMATKDQAYGYFIGAALVLLVLAWRDTHSRGTAAARLRATMTDRPLWAGVTAWAVVYAVAIGALWNLDGVHDHFELITGAASQSYRMFPATPAGWAELTIVTATMLPSALGPVCTAFGALGAVIVARHPRQYRSLALLLVPVLSYLVSFVAVVGYVYDRFLLGITVVAVLLAAVGFEAAMAAVRRPRARRLLTAVLLLAALWPSLLVNWRMATDSRGEVETWLAANAGPDVLVVGAGLSTYLPNLHPFRHLIETTAEPDAILQWNADVVVLNEQWLNRSGSSALAMLEQALEGAGYERVFAAGRGHQSRGRARLGGGPDEMFSNVDKIDPPLSVWRRPDRITVPEISRQD